MRQSGWRILALAGSCILFLSCLQIQGVYIDEGWGLLAAEQFYQGISTNPTIAVFADPHNVAQTTGSKVSWWAPSNQVIPLSFRMLGLSWGWSIRLALIGFWSLGVWGWYLYLRKVLIRAWMVPWVILGMVSLPYVHREFYQYSGGDFYLWCLTPYLMCLNFYSLRSGHTLIGFGTALGAGLGTSLIFLIKFHAAFLGLGIGVSWIVLAGIKWVSWKRTCGYFLGYVLGACVICGLDIPGGNTSFDPAMVFHFHWRSFLWPFGAWIGAMTDWEELIQWMVYHYGVTLWKYDYTPYGYSFIGGIVIIWACLRLKRFSGNLRRWNGMRLHAGMEMGMAVIILVLSCLFLMFISVESQSPLMYPRYLRMEGLLLLPHIINATISYVNQVDQKWRRTVAGMVWIFLWLPTLYGMSGLIKKSLFESKTRRQFVGMDGLAFSEFSGGYRALDFQRNLLEILGAKKWLCFFSDPRMALPFQKGESRMIVVDLNLTPDYQLRELRYHGITDENVLILSTWEQEKKGKVNLIKRSFVEVSNWSTLSLKNGGGAVLSVGRSEIESVEHK